MTKKNNGALETATKPQINKVSAHEIYLVDKKGRNKLRICGMQKANQSKGYVCTNPAGKDTNHPGYAQCSFHDRFLTNSKNTGLWKTLNVEAGMPANLMQLLDAGQQIEENVLVSVDEDIRLLYSLQSYIFTRRKIEDKEGDETEDGYLKADDVELLMKLTGQILKAKDLRAKLNKELQLDTQTVKSFVNQIFKIIATEAAQGTADRIMREIVEGVIVPFKTKGRIKGPDLLYDPDSREISEAHVVD